MVYSNNPYAATARKRATNLVKRGATKAQVARMYGVHRATIGKWMKKAVYSNDPRRVFFRNAPQS